MSAGSQRLRGINSEINDLIRQRNYAGSDYYRVHQIDRALQSLGHQRSEYEALCGNQTFEGEKRSEIPMSLEETNRRHLPWKG